MAGAIAIAAVALAACHPTNVPTANTKVAGSSRPNKLSPELSETIVARGNMALENGTPAIPYYGYLGDGPLFPVPGDMPAVGHTIEASKTEPDKNTYLVLHEQPGADPFYNYGTHFVFQGHETGTPGYITRINLDADVDHRVTLLASQDVNHVNLPDFDGSTWDPFAHRLLFTAEGSLGGGVWQATTDVPSAVVPLTGIIGQGGYEGIQNDSSGNLWIVEDIGGAKGTVNKNAKQPNSFVFRFVPTDVTDLTAGGKLQVLQVQSLATPGSPITFHPGAVDGDIINQDQKDLYSYGTSFSTKWVTIHDTAIDGTTPFVANTLAKAAGGTPMKRPENGVFRPGTGFREFYFTATGDTDNRTEAGSTYGGFGGVFKLSQAAPSADTGTLSLVYRGDEAHTGLDNLAFSTSVDIIAVEDGGETLHAQRNALDSAYDIELTTNYGAPGTPAPTRALAQGRDSAATIDSQYLGMPGFQNEGDNELTGIHVSDGDPTIGGILGAKAPTVGQNGWRVFYTQQHGENITYEVFFGRR